MRKWIVPGIIIAVLGTMTFYLSIPNHIAIKERTSTGFSASAFSRNIMNESTWNKWWPGKIENIKKSSPVFHYNGNRYSILDKKLSSFLLSITNGNDSIDTELILIPVDADSIELEWIGLTKMSNNPITRLQKTTWINRVKKDMQSLLSKIKSFYTHEHNLYTFPIQKDYVTDSTLIFTSVISKTHPTTATIYQLVDKLKAFTQKNGARSTGYPMLNITANADSTYLTKVALPVDKIMKDEGDIHYRWMLGGGNILVTEVKGGPYQIQKAFSEMEWYINDFKRVAPAIPFQSLVTDRRAELDTAKWITKLYWPVM